MKRALISGVNGQDGSFLTELLLSKGYTVYGMMRNHTSSYKNIAHLMANLHFHILYGDLIDSKSLGHVIETAQPDEVYNLAAASFVGSSFEHPTACMEYNGIGAMRVQEELWKRFPRAKFYQASTSEMFGCMQGVQRLDEKHPFHPVSPYGISKLAAHWTTVNARKRGRFACSGILFNHESPRRGDHFVTKKIAKATARISRGLQSVLPLGTLDTARDWGYALDYVRGMWLMLQQPDPDDYVLATGEAMSLRTALDIMFGEVNLDWRKSVYIEDDEARPLDIPYLCGDAKKAQERLGWYPTISTEDLFRYMVQEEIKELKVLQKEPDLLHC